MYSIIHCFRVQQPPVDVGGQQEAAQATAIPLQWGVAGRGCRVGLLTDQPPNIG